MFGTYRFLLACMVVCGHTWFWLFGRPNWVGTFAVFGFYVLSGFLMTRVLHETYGYGLRPFLRFLANRALRIYPSYWVAMLIMVAMLLVEPTITGNQGWLVFVPKDAWGWFHSVVIFGIHRRFTPQLVPPAWSLHVELVFYVLMGLGLSATRTTTGLWLAAATAWTAWAASMEVPFGERYATVLGGALPFAAGSALHFVPRLDSRRATLLGLAIAAAFFLHSLAPGFFYATTTGPAFYVSMLLAIGTTATLRDATAPAKWKRFDAALGNLAYAVFLLHMPVAFLVRTALPQASAPPREWFLFTLPLTIVASVLLHRWVEQPLERARARVRGKDTAPRSG